MAYASRALEVMEAQYQNEVRLAIAESIRGVRRRPDGA